MGFTRAIKRQAKLRMAVAGIAGAGKTWTSLLLALELAEGKPVALIDTEHGSASKYADDFQFDVLELSNFDPRNYIKAIHEAEEAGYAVLIIDSLSHAWNGTGGALELVDSIAKKAAAKRSKDPNSFNAWGEVTPLQNRLIDTILSSPLHIIATMRSKTEYVVEKSADGKSVPRKVGMAPVQRADMEYEFDIYADMDADNTMIIQKSRCRALAGQIVPKPDQSVAQVLKTWLAGAPVVQAEATPVPVKTKTAESPAPKHPPLDEQIKHAKLRAQKLGLACDSAEWAGLLKTCKVAEIKTEQDLAKVIEHTDQFEHEQANQSVVEVKPAQTESEPPVLATEQQIASIKKLCGFLDRSVPDTNGMTDATARIAIKELTTAYKEARAALPVR